MRRIKAVVAFVVLAALLVGVPILLNDTTGAPKLPQMPAEMELGSATGSLSPAAPIDWVSLVAKYGLWLLWGAFALAVLIQLRVIYKGKPDQRIPGLGLLQGLAAILLSAIIASSTMPSSRTSIDESPPTISQSIFTSQQTPLLGGDVTAPLRGDASSIPDGVASAAQDVAPDVVEDNLLVHTSGGAGSVLSAGVIGVLAFRRRETQRQRAAGMRLEMPAPDSAEALLEAQMRQVAHSMSPSMVDRLLRALSDYQRFHGFPLPDIRAARMSAEAFEIYLAAPAHLPLPWISTDDHMVWGITAAAAAGIKPTSAATAPFPTLVTVGVDAAGAHVLLDLEHVASLNIRGSREVAHASIAAIAAELATTPWADDIQITLVGTLPELGPVLDTGRIRHIHSLERVIRELEKRAEAVARALQSAGASSLYEARGRGVLADAWTPEVVLVGGEIPENLRSRLDALLNTVPRVGISVVSVGDGGHWALDLDSDNPSRAILEPAHLPLRIQQLTPQEYADVISLLSGCHRIVPGPTWACNLSDTEPSVSQVAKAAEAQRGLEARTVASSMTTPATAPSALSADATPSTISDEPSQPEEKDELGADETGDVQQLRHPYVRVLGCVELEAPAGTELAEKDRSQALELISYLTLTPGATNEQVSAALWPGREPRNATRNSAVSRARRWLGADHSGELYLPVATTAENFGTYSLPLVGSDWKDFLRFVGTDAASTPTSQLERALALVRGRPFDGTRAGKYTWAEAHVQEMLASIVDVAHEVARRHLLAGNAAGALEAAQIGLAATPEDERLWRDAIRAEWAAGNLPGVWEMVKRCRAHLDDLDVDAEDATEELIAQLHAEAAAINLRESQAAASRRGRQSFGGSLAGVD